MGFVDNVKDLAEKATIEKQNPTTELYELYLKGTLKKIKDLIEKNAKEGKLSGKLIVDDTVVLNYIPEFDRNNVPRNDKYCDYFTYDNSCYAKLKDQLKDKMVNFEIIKTFRKMTWKVTLTSMGEMFLNDLNNITREEGIDLKFFPNVRVKRSSKDVEFGEGFKPLVDWTYTKVKSNIASIEVRVCASYNLN